MNPQWDIAAEAAMERDSARLFQRAKNLSRRLVSAREGRGCGCGTILL